MWRRRYTTFSNARGKFTTGDEHTCKNRILGFGVLTVLVLFFEMVALNGTSERQGLTAAEITLLCQAAGAVLLGALAWRSARLLVSRFTLNGVLAVVITVILAVLAGGVFSFPAQIVSIPLVGMRLNPGTISAVPPDRTLNKKPV